MSGAISELPTAQDGPAILLERLLREQKELTAVERFAQRHERDMVPARARYYQDLIPLSQPGPGEQYAFRVDLDACSGCKACVAACHELNGLEEDETWREVGLLVSSDPELPVLQHVTSSCHHCVEPGCLSGCPAQAYHKDPQTGIVRHLDDQCIGCQYCVWTCPYEAPKFNVQKGIVRKCDMCQQRLAVNDAPACVQSCPNQAIAIDIVRTDDIVAAARRNQFLSAAPDPRITMPATRYLSRRARRRRTGGDDAVRDQPAVAHWSLIFALLLTQLSAGTLFWERVFAVGFHVVTERSGFLLVQKWMAFAAAAATVAAMVIAPLHLGRPWLAFRSLLGWRTSWLSREVFAMGVYSALATVHLLTLLNRVDWGLPRWSTHVTGFLAFAAGIAAVGSSAMVYVATRRDAWSAKRVFRGFSGSTIALGMASAFVVLELSRLLSYGFRSSPAGVLAVFILLHALAVWHAAKGYWHRVSLSAADSRDPAGNLSIESRIARLLRGPLSRLSRLRGTLSLVAGFLIPFLVASQPPYGQLELSIAHIAFQLLLISSVTLVNLGSECLEKYLFFVTAVSKRMPGGMP